jgi:Sulfotransferase family
MPSTPEKLAAPCLVGIYSSGRSGSTWLGSIFDSSPDVAYRFEPIHRTSQTGALWSTRQRMFDGELSAELLELLYQQLLRADAAWEKPPFFTKTWGKGRTRRFLWPAARKLKVINALFRAIHSPPGRPHLVFKEIDNVWMLDLLARNTDARLIYLLRHPCAVVASMLVGVERGVMHSRRLQFLGSRLHEHDAALGEKLADQVETWSDVQKFAWMWRIDVELALNSACDAENILVQGYEQLCLDPIGQSKRAFAHAGIPWNEQTFAFIAASTGQNSESSGNDTRDAYFQVHRDPRTTMSRWRESLSSEDIEAVLEIAQGSSHWPMMESVTADGLAS